MSMNYEKDIIRCHRCSTSKNYEDKGVYIAWLFGEKVKYRLIVWMHNQECKELWGKEHPKVEFREIKNEKKEIGLVKIHSPDRHQKINQNDLEL